MLHQSGKLSEAERLYRQILSSDPGHADALHLLGVIALQSGHREAALKLIGRAIALRGNVGIYHANYANALHLLDRFAEAIVAYQQALALDPNNADTLNALAHTLHLQGHFTQARALYQQTLRVNPHQADALLNLATLQLLEGDFENGWRNYEWRWRASSYQAARRNFAQPLWRGEPLQGARILLHAEQGFGDSLQFLRYLPLVQAAGGRIVLELQEPLCRLAAALPGIVELVPAGKPLPGFDCHCPLMSLPLACQTTLETIPAAPSLVTPARDRATAANFRWPQSGLRVGLAWAGSPTHRRDHQRSIPLALLEAHLRVPGVELFSLQTGEAATQRTQTSALTPLPINPRDFASTAGYIEQLDLVITVDTAVAHLAGALGKPVWLLLPAVPDWRWLLDRSDSPWYPTMRLFRQPEADHWLPVLEAVHAALEEKERARL
jgi:hypothetical protein